MLGAVLTRFVDRSPISVMVRGTLEHVLGAEPLALWYERTAQKQYTRDRLFSTVYALMSQVVLRIQPSGHATYRAHEAQVGTSVVSVYHKLQEIETHTIAQDRLFAAIFLGFGTGLRRGEVLALRWKDVDVKTDTLQVRQTLVRVTNHNVPKGDSRTRLLFQEPKTSQSRHTLSPYKVANFFFRDRYHPATGRSETQRPPSCARLPPA